MKASIISASLLGAACVAAQTSMDCMSGYSYGTDEVIFTVPYTYAQVMSIIGDYKNLTWSGTPYDNVTLNGTDNTVGTARTYESAGAQIVETITTYSKPANGPYEEIHYLGLLNIASLNFSGYAPYDGTTVTPICNGAASTFNFTTLFCASNVTTGAEIFHGAHMTDAQTVGVFLGGQNFTSCTALAGSNSTGTATTSSTASSTPSMVTTSDAVARFASVSRFLMVGIVAAVMVI